MSTLVWFRLLLRAIGLLLIGIGLPYTFSMIGWIIAILEDSRPGFNHSYGLGEASYILAALTQLGLGLWLFLAPGRIVRFCLRDVQGCCIACGYDLRALASPSRCPECGLPISRAPSASDTPPTPPPPPTPTSPLP